jgi:hypothetical protein
MNDTQKIKFAEFLANEAMGLLVEHLDSAEEAAAESIDPADEKPAKAKVGISFVWEAGSANPKVVTKLSFTTSHKDETERTFDPDQMSFESELDEKVRDMGGEKNKTL